MSEGGPALQPVAPRAVFELRFLAPRFWPAWAVAGCLRLAALPAYPLRLRLGRRLGRALLLCLRRRRRIARANLALCFPELDDAGVEREVRAHFEALGVAVFETAAAWFAPSPRISPLAAISGEQHLHAAAAGGRGVILVSAHFVTLEMGMRLIAQARGQGRAYGVFRPHNNPLLDRIMRAGRARYDCEMLERNDVRGMLRALRRGGALWFPPDQDHGPRHSVFAPFFGVPAATVTAASRLARASGAPVVPLYTHQLPGDAGYEVVMLPALEGFPGGDEGADAARLNALLETQVRRSRAQYLWVHRRFKTRPAGAPPVYGPDSKPA